MVKSRHFWKYIVDSQIPVYRKDKQNSTLQAIKLFQSGSVEKPFHYPLKKGKKLHANVQLFERIHKKFTNRAGNPNRKSRSVFV